MHFILEKPIEEVGVSVEFLAMMKRNGFENLSDLLLVKGYDIVKLPLSGYRMLAELLQLLTKYDLIHLVDNHQKD